MNHHPTMSSTERQAHRAAHLANMQQQLDGLPATDLDEHERDDMLLMREEEKIARDVYLQLFTRWGIRPFENISGSEQVHMDMLQMLLQRHGVPDPVLGLPVGHFGTEKMQALHDTLLDQGLQSLPDAVAVGLLIEELDIADLRLARARTGHADSLQVYAELERGSRNHLRAFYRWQQRLGLHYKPAHLGTTDFEEIARSPKEWCH